MTNNITELNPGVHRWVSNRWVVSTPELFLTTNGIVGRGAGHGLLLATNANTYGACRVRMPDGQVIASHVLGLAYHDPTSGSNLMFAVPKDSAAQIVGSSRVVYSDAFTDVSVSLIYEYTKSGVAQHVLFLEAPPDPREFGMDPQRTHLLIISEVVTNGLTPQIQTTTYPSGNESLTDQLVDFGPMRVVPGYAQLTGAGDRRLRIPMQKTLETLSGRTVLIERLQFNRARAAFSSLPPAGFLANSVTNGTGGGTTNGSISKTVRWFARNSLPAPPPVASISKLKEVKQVASLNERQGLDTDWELAYGWSWPFISGYTFLVQGQVHLSTIEIDPGTYIKYDIGSALYCDGPFTYSSNVDWSSSSPAILTSINDNDPSHGEVIPWSSGNPQSGDYGPALVVPCDDATVIQQQYINPGYFQILYAQPVLQANCVSSVDAVVGDPTAIKGGAPHNGLLTVSRSGGDWSQSLTVGLAVYGPAVAGTDYTLTSGGQPVGSSITIPAGVGSVDILVQPGSATGSQFETSLTLYLQAGSGYTLAEPDRPNTIYIEDPTTPPPSGSGPSISGIISWWRGEGDGSDSVNCHDALSAVNSGPGFVANGIYFDANSYQVTVPDSAALNFGANASFSIEGWIRPITPTTDSAYEPILNKYAAGDQAGYALLLSSGQLMCQLIASGTTYSFGPAGNDLRDGRFHHVAVTFDRSSTAQGKLYVDNILWLTFSIPSQALASLANTEPLRIGNQTYLWRPNFNGVIDEISLYNRVLQPNSSDLQAIFNAGRRGKLPVSNPTIATQPQSQTVAGGASVTFSVSASGCSPLTYQWFHNGAGVAGATSSSLLLNAVHIADGGSYTVVVANEAASLLSSAATLTVQEVATPTFSPGGGSYASAQNVTITCPTPGATIHYTFSGIDPATSDATVASGSAVLVDHNLTLKAKAFKSGSGDSAIENQSYRIGDGPLDQPPTVTISPPTGSSFLASCDIPILVQASDADGTIAKVQLFRDGVEVAETTSSVLQYTVPQASAGTYTFTARAFDNAGLPGTAGPAVFTVNTSVPVVSLAPASPFFNSSPGTLYATVLGVNPGSLASLTLNGIRIATVTGTQILTPSLTGGMNTFTLVATDNQKRSNQASMTVYYIPTLPTISITSPGNGSWFATTRINVSGSISGSWIKNVTVNGVPAFITGTTYKALNVPLAVGANTILATVTDLAGNVGTASITVTGVNGGGGSQVDPVQLTATPVAGFAPLTVTLTPINGGVPGSVLHVYYDFDGDGVIDDYSHTDLTPVTHTYTLPGQYFPVVTLVTATGQFSSPGGWNGDPSRLRINVQGAPILVSSIPVPDPIDLKWVPPNFLYVLSRSTAALLEFDTSTTPATEIRYLSGLGSTPTGLDVDSSGNVYVAVSGDNQVRRYSPITGSFQLDPSFNGTGSIGKAGSGNGEFSGPYDIAVSPDGSEIDIADSGNNRIQRFRPDGSFLGSFGQQGTGLSQFSVPVGLSYDSIGYLYVVDSGNNRASLVLPSVVLGTSGSSGNALGQFQGPVNLGLGTRGIYVADTGNNRIEAFEPIAAGHGVSETPFTPRFSLSSQISFNHPSSVTTVGDLLQEKICIADTGNNRVVLVSFPAENPLGAWNSMVAHVLAGDISGAIPSFCSATAEAYRQSFLTIGTTESIADISQIGALTPVFIKNDTAEYYFERSVGGYLLLFPVEFVRENGAWKILEF